MSEVGWPVTWGRVAKEEWNLSREAVGARWSAVGQRCMTGSELEDFWRIEEKSRCRVGKLGVPMWQAPLNEDCRCEQSFTRPNTTQRIVKSGNITIQNRRQPSIHRPQRRLMELGLLNLYLYAFYHKLAHWMRADLPGWSILLWLQGRMKYEPRKYKLQLVKGHRRFQAYELQICSS